VTHDIVADENEVGFGRGWDDVDTVDGAAIRRFESEALLYVPLLRPGEYLVTLDVEPAGPASEGTTLTIFDRWGQLRRRFDVRRRQKISYEMATGVPMMNVERFCMQGADNEDATGGKPLFRVFSVTVRQYYRYPDVVVRLAGTRVGAGWYFLEDFGDFAARWVANDATIVIEDSQSGERPQLVELDLEPGPGCDGDPLELTVLGPGAEVLANFTVPDRQQIGIPLPASLATPYELTLHVESRCIPVPGDARFLNYRAFRSPLFERLGRCERRDVISSTLQSTRIHES